jgi:hypothetical protein
MARGGSVCQGAGAEFGNVSTQFGGRSRSPESRAGRPEFDRAPEYPFGQYPRGTVGRDMFH